jgi:hypothetical protein
MDEIMIVHQQMDNRARQRIGFDIVKRIRRVFQGHVHRQSREHALIPKKNRRQNQPPYHPLSLTLSGYPNISGFRGGLVFMGGEKKPLTGQN